MEFSFGENAAPIHTLLVDSNQIQSHLLARALRRQPQIRVSSCRPQVSSCLEALRICQTDVLLFSDGLPEGSNVLDAVRAIHRSFPDLPIVLLLSSCDRNQAVELLRAGVRGLFCQASQTFKALRKCIRVVHEGQLWVNTEQLTYAIEALTQTTPKNLVGTKGEDLLTTRENQIVGLVAEGLSNRAAATQLRLSENTIKKAILRIFEKLGVSNRVELVLYALAPRDSPHDNSSGTLEDRPRIGDRAVPREESKAIATSEKETPGWRLGGDAKEPNHRLKASG